MILISKGEMKQTEKMQEMIKPRREFLKQTALFTAAGIFSTTALASNSIHGNNPYREKNSFLIKNAEIISMDDSIGELKKGSILVQNGGIKDVAKEIEVPNGIEEINVEGAVVMPGLIDCHWHLWTSLLRSMAGSIKEEGYFPITERFSKHFTVEDMEIATRYAVAEAIYSGITTITDYNHNARNPEFVLAGCRAIAETGVRAHVEYNGYRNKPSNERTDFDGIQEVLKELEQQGKYRLLSLGLGSRGAGYEHLENDWAKARKLGMRIAIHASSNEAQKGQIWQLQERGLLGNDVNIIHGNAITDREIEAVANAQSSITLTPYSEMRIGYGLPVPNKLLDAGINMSIGVDSTTLTGNADLFAVMKLLQNLSNAMAEDEFHIQPKQLLKMATINGARTLGLESVTGSLSPGKRADLIVLKRNDLNFSSGASTRNLVVEATQPQNVDLVMVDGRILKRKGKLTTVNSEETIRVAEAAFSRLQKEVITN